MLTYQNQLIQDINLLQELVSKTYSLMGYGTAAEPDSSGEHLALKWAFEQDPDMRVVFDVGAHKGEWLRMARFVLGRVQYHCFEPQVVAYTDLLKEMGDYLHRGDMWHCINRAVSSSSGKETIYTHIPGAANASLVKRDVSYLNADFSLEETIRTITLQKYCKLAGIERIDFLKLDVEGWEYHICESIMDMVQSNRIKYIQFEYGSANVDSRTFLKDFYKLLRPYYYFYRITPRGLYPCPDYKEEFECFNLANYVLRYNPENPGWK